MKEMVTEELKTSRDKLDSARILFKNKKWADAISRSYYSMYHAARALLRIYGKEPKTHSGMISEFGLTFVNTNLIDKRYGKMLRRAEEARESSDYKVLALFDEPEVKEFLKNAELFLDMAEKKSESFMKGEKFK